MEVKRAAKAAIKDEAGYVKSVNRGRAAMSTLKYGTSAAVPVSVLATLATGGNCRCYYRSWRLIR